MLRRAGLSTASADFAISKDAGQPCPNLRPDFGCSIHDRLRPLGFAGCAAYDCFGAGQHVTQDTFGGRDWRQEPGIAAPMFAAFAIMRQLHELLWYLGEALALPAARPVHAELRRAQAATGRLTRTGPAELAGLDTAALRGEINPLLLRASELARAGPAAARPTCGAPTWPGRICAARSCPAPACAEPAWSARTSAAPSWTWPTSPAPTCGAPACPAGLAASIFLTQAQVDAARGDAATRLPPALARPGHWPPGG